MMMSSLLRSLTWTCVFQPCRQRGRERATTFQKLLTFLRRMISIDMNCRILSDIFSCGWGPGS